VQRALKLTGDLPPVSRAIKSRRDYDLNPYRERRSVVKFRRTATGSIV
jgi:hypothetical protein